MEKRRRARINNYLSQLRDIVLKTLCKRDAHAGATHVNATHDVHDPRSCEARACEETATRYSKLEKADLLELTVNCLKQVFIEVKETYSFLKLSMYYFSYIINEVYCTVGISYGILT